MADHVDAHTCCGHPDDCEHFVCPWSDDTCDGCFGELDGDGFCGSPGCEGSTSGDDPTPEPGSWEWERRHGCMDCGVCDDCIERSRAYFEEMSDAD